MAHSAELTMKIAEWRLAANAGQMTKEQAKAAIAALRQDRTGAHIASTTSRTKKAADTTPINTSALLADLMRKPN